MKQKYLLHGFLPSRIADPVAWVGHMPFAWWFAGIVRPRVFFELGTHSGNSYFTFCQATRDHGLKTLCHAVDVWTGDRHSGEYESSVYDEVAQHNREQYGPWSSLWRMTFDEAASKVPNGSIDLLHIDGLHTYEAVRHDFETWKPKLAENAWVLFHDTQVRDGDFGVWRLWEEIKTRYPWHLEFTHSHGLGVLCLKGGKPANWMIPNSPVQLQMIRDFERQGRVLLTWHEKSKKRQRKILGRFWNRWIPGYPRGLGAFDPVATG